MKKAMTEIIIPELFNDKVNRTTFVHKYSYNRNKIKSRCVLTSSVCTFLTKGYKEVIIGEESVSLDNTHFMLITGGKCFMTEKVSQEQLYESILLFFNNDLLLSFFENNRKEIEAVIRTQNLKYRSIFIFTKDEFINSYVVSLNQITQRSEYLVAIKLQELLQYLFETQKLELCNLFVDEIVVSDSLSFQNIINAQINSDLSVNELAYLCNLSLSSFKRKFSQLFDDSPSNWLRQKRMEHAAFLLKYNKEHISDLYLRFGYSNHSSFTKAFRTVFGITPKEYQRTY